MITNKELREFLARFPDDAEVNIYAFDVMGDLETHETGLNRIIYQNGDIIIDATND